MPNTKIDISIAAAKVMSDNQRSAFRKAFERS